ncbi:MAG TPA: glutamate-cysteine ligase family protein, partial [Thermoleophilaceae bacterium]|nr:glutamate-cysteine ligase family protein [Thermoleophilaceae bacterium]
APFHEGRDTGLASVRPTIAKLLPRQGVPPACGSWEELERELGWGASAGVLSDVGSWWWELRPHPALGTLELRVPDAQTTLSDAAAIAAVAHSLVAWLVERHDSGEPLGAAPTWRIEENRWVACRHGLEGAFADLRTGERRPVRECLNALVDQLEPVAERLGNGAPLAHARRLIERNGAERQRQVAAEDGIGGLAGWLADGFEDGL